MSDAGAGFRTVSLVVDKTSLGDVLEERRRRFGGGSHD